MQSDTPWFSAQKGILWWGIPTAVLASYWIQVDGHGNALSGFLSREFLISLILNLVVIGYLGGRWFAKALDSHLRSK